MAAVTVSQQNVIVQEGMLLSKPYNNGSEIVVVNVWTVYGYGRRNGDQMGGVW